MNGNGDPEAARAEHPPLRAPGRRASRQPLGREPVLDVPVDVLERYDARVLDPTTAVRVPGQPPIRPTVYLSDRLLVSGAASDLTLETLTSTATEHGFRVEPPLLPPELADARSALAAAAQVPDQHHFHSVAIRLVPDESKPAPPPDAWAVLQAYRSKLARDDEAQKHVALDHLLTAGTHVSGHPFVSREAGSPFGGLPMDSYGTPGWGGRAPVAWLGGPPHRTKDFAGRRPVVALLDTGVGSHPWYDGTGVVHKNPLEGGVPIGLQDAHTDPEVTGVITDPLEGQLDTDSGHGTFIAGLIHQQCPDADILSVRVMASDGAVAEHVLLDALNLLVLRQRRAQHNSAPEVIDILSLSLGYYHESPDDVSFDPLIRHPLQELAELGVIVVAAAGNDATVRPLFPAAFAPDADGIVKIAANDAVPIIGVGALNPDHTIALFSNAGPWIKTYRTGAALVSTFPVTFDASAEPSHRLHAFDGWRETLDPDDFGSGFGTWSGTSFAAPVLAGEIAREVLRGDYGPPAPVGAGEMIDRGWQAVTRHTHTTRPT
jgi:subtilisin family serine protease